MAANLTPGIVTFLFTDIEGSTRLWEQEYERMRPALACHDTIARAAVEGHRGMVVKMTGDGVHAVFEDPLDAVDATLELQVALADPGTTNGVAFRVRCGLHVGIDERRDNDFFGKAVNRAARIMSAAHGGQVLLSQAVAALVGDRLPACIALLDLGIVRLRDLAKPEHVYQLVHPQLRHDFPALRSLESTPNNLPQQVTSFIGRDREVAEVKKLLGKNRLLTLLGVGGIGKTRLSLQVAADLMDDCPDGVWFVELAPVADARLVPQAVASVLGVKEEAGRPVLDALLKFVSDRQLLVLLDNCEHLLNSCAELAKRLLQTGSRLSILATSREHLHVAGEASYPVPTLAVPDPHRTITLAALTQYAAVRLFMDRAVAAQPTFQVNYHNAGAISDACHRLDGIPLAIELAAARVRVLSVEKIAERLIDRFRLLTGGDQTALPRQQTLRACIDWSYDLLSEPERALLRRLAVFAGGWTLEAAEAVGTDRDVDAVDVLDLLTHLVEKSLVALEAEGERYRLLETVRQYTQERLNESGEGDQARTRHLAFYVALAEKASPHLIGLEPRMWLLRLDLEWENLLSAHAWCDRTEGKAELGLRLVSAVRRYWHDRGLLEQGYRMTVEALTRAGAQEPSLLRCRALIAAGLLGFNLGRYGNAQEYLDEGLSIARRIGDTQRVVEALHWIGDVCSAQGDRGAARHYLEESLSLARDVGDKAGISNAANSLAELHYLEGDLDVAEPLYEENLTLQRERGNSGAITIALFNLAKVSVGRGSGDRARRLLLEALPIVEAIGSKWMGQDLLEAATALAAFLEEWERAARFYGALQVQMERMGRRRVPADEAFLMPLIARTREALGAEAFAAAVDAGRALGYESALGEVRSWLTSAH